MTEPQETEVRWAEQLRRANRWHTREKVVLLDALKDKKEIRVSKKHNNIPL